MISNRGCLLSSTPPRKHGARGWLGRWWWAWRAQSCLAICTTTLVAGRRRTQPSLTKPKGQRVRPAAIAKVSRPSVVAVLLEIRTAGGFHAEIASFLEASGYSVLTGRSPFGCGNRCLVVSLPRRVGPGSVRRLAPRTRREPGAPG